MERNKLRLLIEKAYQGTPPWDSPGPPKQLTDLVESGVLLPCQTLDVGCGLGQNSLYLAKRGFSVTGIDFSENAISMAKDNAKAQKTKCQFLLCDVLEIRGRLDCGNFAFCLEWGLLHFIMPEERQEYMLQLADTLRPDGLYLSLCFHENSEEWGGAGKKLRVSPLTGAEVYYSSVQELELLYRPHFIIERQEIISMRFAGSPDVEHLENMFLLRRR